MRKFLAHMRPALMRLVVVSLVVVLPSFPASFAEPEEVESLTYTVKFKQLEDAILLLKPLMGDRGSFTVHPRLKAITLMDEPANLMRIIKILSDFDQPPRSVRLSIQVLNATEAAPPSSDRGAGAASVRSLLRDVTKWSEVSVIGSASILGVEGAESSLNVGDGFRVRFSVDTVAPLQGVVKFERFALDRVVHESDGRVRHVPIWDTVINLRDKQRLLLGATSSQESKRAIFLSVTANIEPDNRTPAAN
jgi:hypothetical protein